MGIKSFEEYLNDILILKLKGSRTLYDTDEINTLLISSLQKSEYGKVIIDFSEVKGKRSIIDSVRRAESFPRQFHKYKIALIEATENREVAVAEESVFNNRGFVLRTFFDINDGIDWLKSLNNH